jgi:hypothetical protein
MTGHPGPSFRAILSIAILAGVLLLPRAPAGAAPSPENPAALIYAGWFGNTTPTPSFVSANFDFLESQPFDGIVVYLRNPDLSVNLTQAVMKDTPVSYDTMMSVLAPIADLDFTNLKENLGLVQGSTPPDFFDDWSVVVQNYANIARAAKDSGLKGLCFDNEQYAAPWGDYGGHLKYASTKTLAEYRAQARLRGKEVMEAMVGQFPDIVFLTLHGPYVSETAAPWQLQFPQWQSANELLGPFFAGHMEGAGSTGCCIDGGEIYTLRSQADFQASYGWRRDDLPSDAVDCSFIPSDLRPAWPGRSCLSFGVYDCPFGGAAMNSTVLRSTLANAMRQADRYVWFYAEASTYLLPSNAGGASAEWVDAVRQAKADVQPSPSAPAAPSSLAASAVSPSVIDLSWTDNSSNETGFQVERRTVLNGAWSLVTTTAPGATSHRDESLSAATGYVYRLRAVNSVAASAYTAEVTATTPSVSQKPAAPSGLSGVASSSATVQLQWSDNSGNETGFAIERKRPGTSWSQVATVGAGVTTFQDTDRTSKASYFYRIKAFNGSGMSAASNQVKVTMP